jgi:xanthine dehydrogenase YagR molybdenum-binding subunit
MSIMRKVLETVARFVPDGEPDPLIHGHGHVGKPISRIDGSVKVRGEATFTADFKIANLTHAALVYGTIARGRIARIDATQAEAAPGVIAIVTHENAPRMKRPSLLNVNNFAKGVGSSDLPIMQDDKVHYDGEAVALDVAETL